MNNPQIVQFNKPVTPAILKPSGPDMDWSLFFLSERKEEDLNFNFAVDNVHFDFNLGDKLFSNEGWRVVKPETTMLDLLVTAGVFPSKGQARKNWGGPVEIPDGFTQWIVGKKKILLTIWKPVANMDSESEG